MKLNFAVVSDISKSKEAEERNRNQTLLFATAMDSIPANVFIKDESGEYIACNYKYASDQGVTIDEMIGKSDFDFFEEEIAEKYRQDDKRIMKTGIAEEIVAHRDILIEEVKKKIQKLFMLKR